MCIKNIDCKSILIQGSSPSKYLYRSYYNYTDSGYGLIDDAYMRTSVEWASLSKLRISLKEQISVNFESKYKYRT